MPTPSPLPQLSINIALFTSRPTPSRAAPKRQSASFAAISFRAFAAMRSPGSYRPRDHGHSSWPPQHPSCSQPVAECDQGVPELVRQPVPHCQQSNRIGSHALQAQFARSRPLRCRALTCSRSVTSAALRWPYALPHPHRAAAAAIRGS